MLPGKSALLGYSFQSLFHFVKCILHIITDDSINFVYNQNNEKENYKSGCLITEQQTTYYTLKYGIITHNDKKMYTVASYHESVLRTCIMTIRYIRCTEIIYKYVTN